MNLSRHFALKEFVDSQTAARMGIDNIPPTGSREMANLSRLAALMEEVRSILDNKPILISSGYRAPAVNKAVGGSTNSAHMSGLAVDFTAPGFGGPLVICRTLQPHMRDLGIDQLIYEYSTWVHLAIADKPRYQCLTIDSRGTRQGFG